MTLLKPVVMAPLQREWAEVQADCEKTWTELQEAVRGGKTKQSQVKLRKAFEKRLTDFGHRLADVKVLDPACGSGNFLYVAINLLLDLEKEVITYGANHGVSWFPQVSPRQLAGLEINPYAQQLAQVVIWIGYLQWLHHNGFKTPSNPVLEPIENIRFQDAIVDVQSDPSHPKEPEWPSAEFIVSNPPFLGGKLLRNYLGDEYVQAIFKVWDGRVPREADICCYWFEKARAQIKATKCIRAGLLATKGIRGGANREVLKRIKESGDMFFAESDRQWILDGANVQISMVGFDSGQEQAKILDKKPVLTINTNLTSHADITQVQRLNANLGVAFMGDTKGGDFDITSGTAQRLLQDPNPHGLANSGVVLPWINGLDITRRPRDMWIIDFGCDMSEAEAAKFQLPFEYIREHVYPIRKTNNREAYRLRWWLHVEPRPGMRQAIFGLSRFLVTVAVSKHRLFIWMQSPTLPDHAVFVFCRSDDYFFGIVHSRVHEVWGLKLGTRLETRPRYTPTTSFETFAFPEPNDEQKRAVSEAAKELDHLRNNWLNPPEWTREEVLEFPGSIDGPWAKFVHNPDARGIGTVRYPRIIAKDPDCAELLAKRTLTNLYNERPTWLDLAHRKLDEAVFAAYGWEATMSDEEILAKLLELNLKRSAERLVNPLSKSAPA